MENLTILLRQTLPVFLKFFFALFFFQIAYSPISAQSSSNALNIKVNFQDPSTIPPTGWVRDFGQPYGARTSSYQGSGNYYGWIKRSDKTPLDLTKNGRKRSTPSDILLATVMHMQANNLSSIYNFRRIEGIWQARTANGKYDVTVSVGDDIKDSKHTINVEGVSAIAGFVPTSTQAFKSATVTVTVSDGFLTIDAIGGTNTKINTITVKPAGAVQPAKPSVVSVNPANGAVNVNENTSISTNILELPNSGINNSTITSSSVYLTENATGTLIPSSIKGTGGGDAITLVPSSSLKSNTTYKFHITSAVKDLSGASFIPYSSTFTTTGTSNTSNALNIKVNFQNSATIPPTGWARDFGQPYGARTSSYQGSGNYYGWIKRSDKTPLDLTKNGRKRSSPSDILLATVMHMQAHNLPSIYSFTRIEGIWQARTANGKYDVTVSVGDNIKDSKHTINVEGVNAIAGFVSTSTQAFKSATVTVTVSDGFLTIDALGGTNTKINTITVKPANAAEPAKPSVVSVNPLNGAVNISANTSISTNVLKLPNGGINNSTINSRSVYLTENATGALVPSHVNGTGGGDAITLVPSSSLKSNTNYKFHITSGVKDLSGASFIPYSSRFTTKATPPVVHSTIAFDKISLPNATGRHSSLTIGPDGKLYALTIDGIIKRFSINANGTLGTPQLLYSLQNAYGTRKQRLAIGFAFDPSATATNLVAWVTHSSYVFLNGPSWDGKLTKLSGSNLQNVKDVLVNLPRSTKDHVTNSIAFGPDRALYFMQASISAMGRAEQTWGYRNENLLSAAVLRLDVSKLGTLPLNVKTYEGGGTYNPYNLNSPLTIYASGVRNAYDLVWHSNGSLYVPTNGSAAGGNTPASVNGTIRTDGRTYNGPSIPALTYVKQTQKDFLYRVVKGGYYGHPNALRGEYVMNGGNPTSGTDRAEVPAYPVGIKPDVNWRGYSFNFQNNVSPNGAIEYKSSAFNGALKGKLLVVRYSQHDDIITLTPGTSKDIVSSIEGKSIAGFSGFVDPLDLTENVKNGNIYVSEYGGNGKITLLRPQTRATSITVQKVDKEEAVSAGNPYQDFPACDDTTAYIFPPREAVLALQSTDASEKPRVNPNPIEKRFSIEFPKSYEGDFTIQIIDPLGKTFDLGKKRLTAGGSNMSADISKFSFKPGIYFLKIQSDTKTEIIKLVKQ